MQGDELLQFGFKRIVEELTLLRKEVRDTRDVLVQISKATRDAASKADNIEHNTFIANDTLIQAANSLDRIQKSSFTTELNTIRINQALNKEGKANEPGKPVEGI